MINAGGIIDIYYERSGGTTEQLKAHLDGIGDTLKQVFVQAQQQGRTTTAVADAIAVQRFSVR